MCSCQVRETQELLSRILLLLDKVKFGSDSMKVLLQLISNIGSSEENKIEIGRLNGFRKLFELLPSMVKDEALAKEIMRTLRRFLDVWIFVLFSLP